MTGSEDGLGTQYSECWNCESDTFRLIIDECGTVAECTQCGEEIEARRLYQPDDPNPKDSYEVNNV